MRAFPATLVLAAALAAGGAGAPAPPAPDAVDAAIARAVKYLRGQQEPDGSFKRDLGKTGLGVFALAHAGVPADDPAISRGTGALLAALVRPDVYGASLAVMALATVDPVLHGKRVERLAKMIADSQCDNGQWSYRLSRGRGSGDNSNTQFAVLALWHARGCGADLPPEVFARCRKFFAATQNEDGGWGYSAQERKTSYGSMTATGLAALVVARAGEERRALAEAECRAGPEVAKATAWLRDHLALDRNPGANFRIGVARGQVKEVTDAFWRHYWLWSLERAATLSGAERLGDRDWYAEGARWLLDSQRDDGSWVGSEAPFEATSFALLFLTRSTRRAVATEKPILRGTPTEAPR